jgi:hypothetical protein
LLTYDPNVSYVKRFTPSSSALIVVGDATANQVMPLLETLFGGWTVLGGSFSSRLNMNLREKHGYTYGASSAFDAPRPGTVHGKRRCADRQDLGPLALVLRPSFVRSAQAPRTARYLTMSREQRT